MNTTNRPIHYTLHERLSDTDFNHQENISLTPSLLITILSTRLSLIVSLIYEKFTDFHRNFVDFALISHRYLGTCLSHIFLIKFEIYL